MGVHEGEAFSAITKSIGSAPPALFVVLLFALARYRFRLLLIGSSFCPICRDAASCQCRVAQAMEAAGISGYGTAGRAVRTSTSSAATPSYCSQSAGDAPRTPDSVRPQCGWRQRLPLKICPSSAECTGAACDQLWRCNSSSSAERHVKTVGKLLEV